MGADITESNFRDEAEPVCDLTVKYSKLHGVEVGGAIIPRLIDELPVIAVAPLHSLRARPLSATRRSSRSRSPTALPLWSQS